MKALDLKNSILQLAMEGKLVPQNPDDVPAKELLAQIQKEKEKLIKDKKIKRNSKESVIFRDNGHFYEKVGKKGEPVCIDDEIPFDIPKSWVWCRLRDILTKLTDGAHTTPKYTDSGIPFLSVKDMSSGKLIFSNTKFISKEEHDALYKRCNPEKNDVLLTKVGTTGIPVLVDTDKEFSLFVSVALLKFNHDLIYNKYLITLINSPLVRKQCIENTKGVGNKNLVLRDINKSLIVLPPLEEQKRIVKKIEELIPYVEEYGEAEEKLEELIETFPEKIKASILQEAVQGKLVPQNPDDEPANILFEKIVDEKEKVIKKFNYKQKLDPNYLLFDELPFDLPKGWIVCKLDQLSENIHYGYTISADFEKKDIKLLRITDIQNNKVSWDTVPGCNVEIDKINNHLLNENDILIARTGGTVGKTFIVENLPVKSIFASYLIRVIPIKQINAKYLKLFLESPFYWDQLLDKTKGTGQPNVNATNLKKLIVTLPPLSEQKRIVKRVKQILKIIDELSEAILHTEKNHKDLLTSDKSYSTPDIDPKIENKIVSKQGSLDSFNEPLEDKTGK